MIDSITPDSYNEINFLEAEKIIQQFSYFLFEELNGQAKTPPYSKDDQDWLDSQVYPLLKNAVAIFSLDKTNLTVQSARAGAEYWFTEIVVVTPQELCSIVLNSD